MSLKPEVKHDGENGKGNRPGNKPIRIKSGGLVEAALRLGGKIVLVSDEELPLSKKRTKVTPGIPQ